MEQVTIELYLHGTSRRPLTAYSMLACRILAVYGVEAVYYDITTDQTARARATALSGVAFWPQIMINGEYLGGTEVLAELLRTRLVRPAAAS